MKHYEVAVVTMFHSADTDAFIDGIESMKAHTCVASQFLRSYSGIRSVGMGKVYNIDGDTNR